MGYKLFFDKSPDKVVCTILSQNIYTHLHTFAPLSIWNHAMLLNFCSQYFHYKTASGTWGFLLAVSISFFPFLLPLYLTIIRLNSVKVLTYAHQLQKKASGTKSTNLVKLPDIASHGFRRFGFQIELGKKDSSIHQFVKKCK